MRRYCNAPMIICADADMDLAVNGTMGCKFRNAGQTCICVNRVFAHESTHEAYLAWVVERVKGIVLGNGLRPGVTQGPQIDAAAHKSMQAFVDDAVAKGAKIEAGGKNPALGGLFYEPPVLSALPRICACSARKSSGRFCGTGKELLGREETATLVQEYIYFIL